MSCSCGRGRGPILAHTTGHADRRWTLADFDLPVHRRHKGEPEPVADTGRTPPELRLTIERWWRDAGLI